MSTTRTTTQLRRGDRATTPDGGRTGTVRHVHEGGVSGAVPGQADVRFEQGSVEVHDATAAVAGREDWARAGNTAGWTVR